MAKEKFTSPKVGDKVNHVSPLMKVTVATVVAVDEKTEGRQITVELPQGEKTVEVNVVHRPEEKIAGNTWHAALIAVLMLLSYSLRAGIPTYHTYSAAGNSSAPATVILPADPNSQIRVVNAWYTSDNAAGAISFNSGTTAYSLTVSNAAATSVTNIIDSTNGLAVGSSLILQHAGLDYTNYVVSFFNTGTNGVNGLTNAFTSLGLYGTGNAGQPSTNVNYVVIASGGWGVYALANDEIYLEGPTSTIFVGIGTNSINGDDIFSGNYGRPVLVQIAPATGTNRLSSLSAHYDSQSQP